MNRILTEKEIEDFNEKLVLTFRNLRKNNNLLTRQNLCNSREEAITTLIDLLDTSASNGKRRSGAVYYHRGDKTNVNFGKVAIRFTDYLTPDCSQEQSDENAKAIGLEIVSELKRSGLSSYWNGSPNSVVWAFLFKEDAEEEVKNSYTRVG